MRGETSGASAETRVQSERMQVAGRASDGGLQVADCSAVAKGGEGRDAACCASHELDRVLSLARGANSSVSACLEAVPE